MSKFVNFWKCWNTYIVRDKEGKTYTLTEYDILNILNNTKLKETQIRKNIKLEMYKNG